MECNLLGSRLRWRWHPSRCLDDSGLVFSRFDIHIQAQFSIVSEVPTGYTVLTFPTHQRVVPEEFRRRVIGSG